MVELYGNIFSKIALIGGTPCWGRLPDFEHAPSQADISSWINEIIVDRPKWTQKFIRNMFHSKPDPMIALWLWNQSMMLPLHAGIKTFA